VISFTPTPEHAEWVQKAERLKPIFAERARALDERGGSPEENMAILRDEGFHKLVVPAEYGGFGTEAAWCAFTPHAVIETLASACASTAWGLLSHFHGTGLIVGLGNEEQRRRILTDVVENGAMVATVGSEVRAREKNTVGDATGKLTFASELRPVDGGFIANGTKGFSSMGADSKYICYWSLAPGTDLPSTGVTVSVIEKPHDGVVALPGWEEAIGIRASLSGGTKFEDVFIPWENVLGEPGDHMQVHTYTFELTYTVHLLGIAQGVFDFVKQTLAERPFLQTDDTLMYSVGEMASMIQATRASWYYAQWIWDQGDHHEAAHASLKALHQAKETAMMVCTKAFEAVGVRALFRWNPIERAWRDARTVTLHTRESLLMRVVAEAEASGDRFAKQKYGVRVPDEERVTWASLGLPRREPSVQGAE
jgi:alkylation response protein AidB-like acyl-CoA dehydrogenase